MPQGKNYQEFLHGKQISATEKVHRISYTRKRSERFNGSYSFEYRERYSINITISTAKSFYKNKQTLGWHCIAQKAASQFW